MGLFGSHGKKGDKPEKKEDFVDTLVGGLESMKELCDVVDAQGKKIDELETKVTVLEKKLNVVIKHLGG